MKISINGKSVNFQPETSEEEVALDKMLEFQNKPIQVFDPRGAVIKGEIGGHESQRWVRIF